MLHEKHTMRGIGMFDYEGTHDIQLYDNCFDFGEICDHDKKYIRTSWVA